MIVTFFSKGSVFIINMLSAKFLTASEFGLLSILRSTAGMLESLFTGVNSGVIIDEVSKNKKVTANLLSLLLFYLVVILIILSLIPLLKVNISITSLFLLTFGVTLSTTINLVLIGLSYYSEQKKLTVVSSVLSLIISFVLVKMYGLQGAINAFILLAFTDFIIKVLFLAQKKVIFTSIHLEPTLIKRSFKYIIIIAPQIILFWWLKVSLSNSALEDLGRFEFLYQFVTLITLMTGTVSSVAIGRFSTAEKNIVLKQSLVINFLICIILVSLSLSYGNNLILLVNKEYDVSERMLLFFIMLLVVFPLSFASLISKFFLANSKDSYNLLASISAVLSTLALIVFLTEVNIFTIAYSYIGYHTVNFLILLFLLIRFQKANE